MSEDFSSCFSCDGYNRHGGEDRDAFVQTTSSDFTGGPMVQSASDATMTPVAGGKTAKLDTTPLGDVCSVCLSPFCAPRPGYAGALDFADCGSQEDADDAGIHTAGGEDGGRAAGPPGLVTTRCNHTFHACCLEQVRRRKPECPNCRAKLTPHECGALLGDVDATSPQELRQTIASNASRVRGAMERARLQRLGIGLHVG